MLATLARTSLCRLLAAFIVVLVVSPYSEPFATMDGTDFGAAGAVDVSPTSKVKTSAADALAAVPIMAVADDGFLIAHGPLTRSVMRDPRHSLRAVLRL